MPRLPDTLRINALRASLAASALLFLAGASCKKETTAADTGAVAAADRAAVGDPSKGGAAGAPGGAQGGAPVDTAPLPGVDLAKLDDKQQALFHKLVAALPSPCGKAHSLRTSVAEDKTCKRAPFAARYVAALIADEAPEREVREAWEAKYKAAPTPARTFALDGVPHAGPVDAPVQMVEFFDYGCPACREAKPLLEEVVARNPGTVAVFYKQYPLTRIHPNSMNAAKAALAAHAQGRFKEMHDKLFEVSPAHDRAAVTKLAEQLGLDMARFTADFDAAEARIRAEMKEGDEAGVEGTPSLFFAGRPYEGPFHPDYLGYWIAEELAVNH